MTTRGAVIAVCGLHGGAGTTTTALLLAAHAASRAPQGAVAVTETAPWGGGLAAAPEATDADARSVISPAPAGQDARACIARLRELASAHALLVVDAGSVREARARIALEEADAGVVWAAAEHRLARLTRAPLMADLADPAERARRQILAVSAAEPAVQPTTSGPALPEPPVRPHATVLLARLAGATPRDERYRLAGASLARALV